MYKHQKMNFCMGDMIDMSYSMLYKDPAHFVFTSASAILLRICCNF